MKAEATLQFMADFYPRIFPTRKHALNQLFCVIGNGFDWVDGELVDTDSPYLKRYKMDEDSVTKAKFPNEDQWNEMHEFFTNLYESEDKPDKIPMEYQFEWYPLAKDFAKLYTFPSDIKPDWKALIDECVELIKHDHVYVDEEYIKLRYQGDNN